MRKIALFAVLAIVIISLLGGARLLKFQNEETAVDIPTNIPAAREEAPSLIQKNETNAFCLSCHGEVKSFHYPAKISAIDRAKGMSPRICISCHGQKVHEVHKKRLDAKAIVCNTCHQRGEEIYKPQAEKGMLLVCELCHAKGNYIEIHIEGNILKDAPLDEKWVKSYALNNTCSVCHFGEYSFVHANVLARWREKIENITRLAEIEPLNISYL